ncbi:MAG: metallophosphoesterase family protein [Haloferula sp.]
MKILLVADLHYTLRQWDWVLSVGDRFDMVVVAGDLLDIGSIVPLEAQIVVVRKYLDRIAAKAPLLVSSGNHDVLDAPAGDERNAEWLLKELPEGVHVDGAGIERDGLFLSVLPWWDGPHKRREIEAQLESQSSQAKGKRWIWIYHPPPVETEVSWDGRADHGDTHLKEWLREHRPWLVLGGHIHNAPFVRGGSWIDQFEDSFLFNSGRQLGGVPTFTLIDTDAENAKWISIEDAEQADLKGALQRRPLDE